MNRFIWRLKFSYYLREIVRRTRAEAWEFSAVTLGEGSDFGTRHNPKKAAAAEAKSLSLPLRNRQAAD